MTVWIVASAAYNHTIFGVFDNKKDARRCWKKHDEGWGDVYMEEWTVGTEVDDE